MNPNRREYPNRLEMYRRRMGFDVRHVARLLGHADPSSVLSYERGVRLPSLVNAFGLGIILRVPVEFLFPALYEAMRDSIRAQEDSPPRQLPLF